MASVHVLWALLAWFTVSGATTSVSYHGGGPTATLHAGVVIGTTTSLPGASAAVNKFLGIPFAKSPPERFAPPVDSPPWSQPLEATQLTPACIQQFVYPKEAQEFTEALFNQPPPVESEDCLYLNRYAPSTPPPPGGRAVMYWIYGGSLQFGYAGQSQYDGSAFAAYEDVIVVSANYRTNVFGFPSSPEIPLDQRNVGFLDQRFGLEWVQDNIAAFGGSPDKVTVFGESSGAISTDALITSYATTPPFRAAILQSGQVSYGLIHELYGETSSIPAWNNMSKLLGCPGEYDSDLECVRAASAQDVKQVIETNVLQFYPTADNVTLVSDGAARRLAGNIANVPIVTGTNAQEGRVFVIGQTNTTAFIETSFGAIATPELVKAIEEAYPLGTDGLDTPYDQIAQIYTELLFQCPQGLYANETAKAGIPVWRYYFNASFVNTQGYPGLGAYHSSEIPIVFSTYPEDNVTTQEYALSTAMRGAWARFAKNPLSGPGWNAVGTGGEGSVLVGANETAVGGILDDSSGTLTKSAWDLAVWGNGLDALGSGATVIDQYEVDYRCAQFEALVSGGVPT